MRNKNYSEYMQWLTQLDSEIAIKIIEDIIEKEKTYYKHNLTGKKIMEDYLEMKNRRD